MVTVLQPPDDLGGGLPALVFAEEFLDVLNLQRALLERILRDAMFQDVSLLFYRRSRRPGEISLQKENS